MFPSRGMSFAWSCRAWTPAHVVLATWLSVTLSLVLREKHVYGFQMEYVDSPVTTSSVKLSSAGDVNRDGLEDIFITIPQSNKASCGRIELRLSITTGGVSNTASWSHTPGPDVASGLCPDIGRSVAPLGDTNGDGFGDIAVGSPDCINAQGVLVGCVHVFGGTSSGLGPSPISSHYGTTQHGQFGSIISTGDVNGDGHVDLIVASPGGKRPSVAVYHGSATGIASTPARTIVSPIATDGSDGFARALAVGPLKGGSRSDVVIGAPNANQGRGAIVVVWGGNPAFMLTIDPPSTSAVTANINGDGTSIRYGSALAISDMNGDKKGDVVVGAPWAEAEGVVYVYGTATIWPSATPRTGFMPLPSAIHRSPVPTTGTGVRFGTTLTSLGDLNGDGFEDVAAGSSDIGCAAQVQGLIDICGATAVGRNLTHGIISSPWRTDIDSTYSPLQRITLERTLARGSSPSGVMCCVDPGRPTVYTITSVDTLNSTGVAVVIRGTGLGTQASDIRDVTVGGIACTDVHWKSRYELTCTAHPRPRQAGDGKAGWVKVYPVVTTIAGESDVFDTAYLPQTLPTYCPLDCSFRGTCNISTGECACPPGFTGRDCSQVADARVCNDTQCACLPGFQGRNCTYTVRVTRGTSGEAFVNEAGQQYKYFLRLSVAPAAPVTITINTTTACFDKEIFFEPSTFILPSLTTTGSLTIVGVADNKPDNDTLCPLDLSAKSDDPDYNGLYKRIDSIVNRDVRPPVILTYTPQACPLTGCVLTIRATGLNANFQVLGSGNRRLNATEAAPTVPESARQSSSTWLLEATATSVTTPPTSSVQVTVPGLSSPGYQDVTVRNSDGGSSKFLLFFDHADALVCGNGTYYSPAVRQCESCPTSAVCRGGSRLYAQPGSLVLPGSTAIVPCTPADRCGGVSEDGQMLCGPGYAGATCSDCADSYYEVEGSCVKCDGGGNVFYGLLFVYAAFGFVFISAIFFAQANVVESFVEALLTVQFLSTLGASSAYNLPPIMKEAESYMRLLSFNSSFLRVGCFASGYSEPDVGQVFLTNLGTYACMAIIFTAIVGIIIVTGRSTKAYVFEKFIRGHILMWAAFFSLLSNSAFPVVHCVAVGAEKRVAVALTQTCHDGAHLFAEIAAYLLLFFQAVSILAVVFLVLLRESEWRNSETNIARYGYLYHSFKEPARWTNCIFFTAMYVTSAIEVTAVEHQTAVYVVQMITMGGLVLGLLMIRPFTALLETILVAITLSLSCAVLTAKFLSSRGQVSEDFSFHYGRVVVLVTGLLVLAWMALVASHIYSNYRDRRHALQTVIYKEEEQTDIRDEASDDDDMYKEGVTPRSLDDIYTYPSGEAANMMDIDEIVVGDVSALAHHDDETRSHDRYSILSYTQISDDADTDPWDDRHWDRTSAPSWTPPGSDAGHVHPELTLAAAGEGYSGIDSSSSSSFDFIGMSQPHASWSAKKSGALQNQTRHRSQRTTGMAARRHVSSSRKALIGAVSDDDNPNDSTSIDRGRPSPNALEPKLSASQHTHIPILSGSRGRLRLHDDRTPPDTSISVEDQKPQMIKRTFSSSKNDGGGRRYTKTNLHEAVGEGGSKPKMIRRTLSGMETAYPNGRSPRPSQEARVRGAASPRGSSFQFGYDAHASASVEESGSKPKMIRRTLSGMESAYPNGRSPRPSQEVRVRGAASPRGSSVQFGYDAHASASRSDDVPALKKRDLDKNTTK